MKRFENSTPETPLSTPATYVPGYVGAKRLMLLFGLGLVLFGATQLWRPLRLTLFGEWATAETVAVVKEQPGLPPVTLNTEAQLRADVTAANRGAVYWNVFSFQTQAGDAVTVRAGTGSQLKPLYPLTGWDGLPTTDRVCFDPADPQRPVFPLIVSTWLAPAVLIFAGTLCSLIAASLLRWARKPIEIPKVSDRARQPPLFDDQARASSVVCETTSGGSFGMLDSIATFPEFLAFSDATCEHPKETTTCKISAGKPDTARGKTPKNLVHEPHEFRFFAILSHSSLAACGFGGFSVLIRAMETLFLCIPPAKNRR